MKITNNNEIIQNLENTRLQKAYERLGFMHEHITDELGVLDPEKHDALIRHKLSTVRDIYNERKAIFKKLWGDQNDKSN